MSEEVDTEIKRMIWEHTEISVSDSVSDDDPLMAIAPLFERTERRISNIPTHHDKHGVKAFAAEKTKLLKPFDDNVRLITDTAIRENLTENIQDCLHSDTY